jgi:hypothetical protein
MTESPVNQIQFTISKEEIWKQYHDQEIAGRMRMKRTLELIQRKH